MRKRFGLLGISAEHYSEHIKPMTYNVHMQDGGSTAVIDIEGYIGRDLLREWITGEKSKNTVENLKSELRSFSADKIIVNIHSPGGDLSEGLVIKDMLQAKQAEVVTNTQGFSASAATGILQAGTKRRMSKDAFILIHRAMLGVMGFFNQNSTKAMTEDLEVIDNRLIQMYHERTRAIKGGASYDDIADLMDQGEGYGKWIDAETALEMGFIDEIYDPADQDDEDLDRLENKQKAVEASLRNGSESFADLLEQLNISTSSLQPKENSNKGSVSAAEARDREQEVKNLIFKQTHEV